MKHSSIAERLVVALLISFLFLAPLPGFGQSIPTLTAPATAKAAPDANKPDPLKRSTPRSAIYAFLEAIHDGNDELAAQYLDLRHVRPLSKGPELANQLGLILNRDSQFAIGRLSNQPTGSINDGLGTNQNKLEEFQVSGKTITLYMQREMSGDQQIWLVSSDSVAHIPELAALATESPIEKRIPELLVKNRLFGAQLWIWLALLLAVAIVSLVSRSLARAFLFLIRPVTKRYSSELHVHRLKAAVEPLRRIVAVSLLRAAIELIAPPALLRDSLLKLLSLIFIWAIAELLMVVVDVVYDAMTSRMDVRERAISYSALPLLARSVKIVIGILALLSVVGSWGYNVNTILAGLGVGGIAVALAAQKTIENLFGGVSVISDKPVLVGDFCQFGGQVGTVIDIGLRSTRIRTLDRTVVTVPNSSFSTMTLENYSQRDRMWFHPTINLRRDTHPDKIRAMMSAITKILEDHPEVDATGIPLRFTKIGMQSFDLEIFAYVLTEDFNEYLRIQSELLLGIVGSAVALSVEFAVPIEESVAPSFSDLSEAKLKPSNAHASNNAPVAGR